MGGVFSSTAKLYVFVVKKDVVTASIHPRHKWRGILEAFNSNFLLAILTTELTTELIQ